MAYKKANDKYRNLWKRDNGPLVNKWDIDYSYYSPVDYGADKNKKYPLCIFLVGALEGAVEGLEIQANEIPLWCDEKYQSRFHNEASYIMIPRAPEEDGIYWDQSCLVDSLKETIKGMYAGSEATVPATTEAAPIEDTGSASVGIAAFAAISVAAAAAYVCTKKN